ncbi:uncharacterized protein PFL1_00002 [Pseudozyma flocculosa PF-1]|uniref:Uncharacterized protein n=1 Tax=Pseudozyma flocculosa TaxID=84751 RepID=A0A5C3EVW8_9BASI|nr:uncharacterized protein PFL1_00002 [Pseudozyma flocculosa PF-1]EPQ31803.1 hypothetical protein PFL1_00002 [Pseudozyma flocculosa PF-1]SPO35309.1 uncharacterized protein PSFLO_00780 [Pseudozyma flocculosa]
MTTTPLAVPPQQTADRSNVYIRAAFNYIDAINEAVSLPQHNPTRLRDCMSAHSVVEMAPASMIPDGKETALATAEDQIGFLAQMRSLVKESNVQINDYILAPGPRVVLQAKGNGTSHSGQAYTNDYVFFLSFVDVDSAARHDLTDFERQGGVEDRAGLPKVTFTREYVDSAFLKGYIDQETRNLQGK